MNSIDQEYLINCSEDVIGKSIYRVFKIEHLLEWFKTGKVAFCRPDEWEDPWEARLFKKSFRLNHDTLGVLPFMKLFYAQCWTRHEKESDLIWKLYSPNRTGVRVKTTINQFYDYLIKSKEYTDIDHKYHPSEMFVGKVIYNEDLEIKKVSKIIKKRYGNTKVIDNKKRRLDKTVVNILFKKRKAFHHEKEFIPTGGGSFGITNIGIWEDVENDVLLISMEMPNYSLMNNEVEIAGSLKNIGNNNVTSFEGEYWVNGTLSESFSVSGINFLSF